MFEFSIPSVSGIWVDLVIIITNSIIIKNYETMTTQMIESQSVDSEGIDKIFQLHHVTPSGKNKA